MSTATVTPNVPHPHGVTAPALVTIDQFLEMQFDGPVELVRGEIVELTRPDQSHGNVCAHVSFALMRWAYPQRLGQITTNDSGIVTDPEPGTLRGSDVAFFAASQLTNGKLPRGQVSLVPILCVEVLSPSNTWSGMRRKIDEYLSAGVREVWLVDPELRTVDRFRSDSGSTLHRESQTLISVELPGFAVPITDFFAGVE